MKITSNKLSTSKSILVTHLYSNLNLGDAALTQALVNFLEESYHPRPKLYLSTMDKVHNQASFLRHQGVSSFFYEAIYAQKNIFNRLSAFLFVISIVPIFVWIQTKLGLTLTQILPKKYRHLLQIYQNTDIHIAVGGGYLTTVKSPERFATMILHLHSFFISYLFGKPFILYSQSIGPFKNRLIEYLAQKILNQAELIMVRDTFSFDYLTKLNIRQPKLIQTVDSAFSLNVSTLSPKPAKHYPTARYLIGITAKRFASNPVQNQYETAIAQAIEQLSQTYQAHFICIPQVTDRLHNDDDRLVHNRIANLVTQKNALTNLVKPLNLKEAQTLYATLDYLIGTRMHSNIFALQASVPNISLAYEQKSIELFKQFQIGELIIKAEEATTQVIVSKVIHMIENTSYYKDKIKNNLTKTRSKIHKTNKDLKSTLYRIK